MHRYAYIDLESQVALRKTLMSRQLPPPSGIKERVDEQRA
jgi:hypothetical protein